MLAPAGEVNITNLINVKYQHSTEYCVLVEHEHQLAKVLDFSKIAAGMAFSISQTILMGFNTALTPLQYQPSLAALGEHSADAMRSFREGVLYLEDKSTDVFSMTLDKSDTSFTPDTQYDDYAISENLFHWQSHSRTFDTSHAYF